jgi:HTH-type transcriptional regulator/antitoxin HigA
MDVRPIHNDDDYTWALKEITPYFENEPEIGSRNGDRFEVLATLIEAYENRTVRIPDASPLEVLRFAIESLGHTQSELADILGSRSRASEVLRGTRRLTIDMIAKISAHWHIPAGALIDAPNKSSRAA